MNENRLIETFKDRWTALGGHYYQADGLSDVGVALTQAWHELVPYAARVSGNVVYWADTDLAAFDWNALISTWTQGRAIQWDGTHEMRGNTAEAVLGISGCAWAVSATGSVALYSTLKTGLLPSVLAPAHLILIRRDQVVATLREGLSMLKGQRMPPLMKMITGPSTTADIEGTLVTGVHGPGKIGAVVYRL